MAWTERFRHAGVAVSWDPEAGLLRMEHEAEGGLSEDAAWVLGKEMGGWIRGLEGSIGAVVDARGVAALPDDWRDYWIKVLRKGFVKGVAVHGATKATLRTMAQVARLTGVPFAQAPDEPACARYLAGLPPRTFKGPLPAQP